MHSYTLLFINGVVLKPLTADRIKANTGEFSDM